MKKKTSPQTPVITSTDELLQQFLAPIIAHCDKTRGAAVELTRLYNEGLEKPITASNLRRWITTDTANRVPPIGGKLLRLLDAWRSLRGADVLNVPETSLYCAAHGHTPAHNGRECERCKAKL